jgi:hypothetical protein
MTAPDRMPPRPAPPPVVARLSPDQRRLTLLCPFCRAVHVHAPDLGVYAAVCGRGTYRPVLELAAVDGDDE